MPEKKPKKPARELTTEEAMRKLFPKRLVDEAQKDASDPSEQAKRSIRKDSK